VIYWTAQSGLFAVDSGSVCDDIRPAARRNCGYGGITRQKCLKKGCCWDTKVRGVPWCFHTTPLTTTPATTTPTPTTEEATTMTLLPGPNCYVADPQDRVSCAFPGVGREMCESVGCCWDKSVYGVPWCFYGSYDYYGNYDDETTTTDLPTITAEPAPVCDVSESDRVDCGYGGITPSACRERNCCWDEAARGMPWCFFGKVVTEPPTPQPNCDVVSPSDRVDCGYPGIHPDKCLKLGCCWDETVLGVAWCFHGQEPNCDVSPATDRVDCGYAGIHPDNCRKRNCCWDESILGVPWCFFGAGSVPATTAATATATQPPIAHCDVPAKSRKRCGDQHDVSREQCVENKNCCWQASKIYGVPSCYYAGTRPGPAGCDPQLPHRMTCGYAGIKEKECVDSHGCCWDDSVPGRPKCYRPNTGWSFNRISRD